MNHDTYEEDFDETEFELLADLNQFTQDVLTLHRVRQTLRRLAQEMERIKRSEEDLAIAAGSPGTDLLAQLEIKWKLQGKI